MKKETTAFLDAYKRLEGVIKKSGLTMYDWEKNFVPTEDDYSKMRICRLTRNLIAHEYEDFIYPSQQMIDFLNEKADSEEAKYEHVKDRMVRLTAISSGEKIRDAVIKLSKRLTGIPVIDADKNFKGMFMPEEAVRAVAADTMSKSIEKAAKLQSLKATKTDVLIDTLMPGTTYVVTDTGKPDGKYKGLLRL